MRLTRRGRLAVTLTVAVIAVAVLVAVALVRTPVGVALGLGAGPECTLTVGDEEIDWSRTEAMTATTTAGVGTRIGATENGVAAAVRRVLARDGERALSPAQAREVYRRLPDVAHSSAAALALARTLLGTDGPALTCVVPLGSGDLVAEAPGDNGLTSRAESARVARETVFGPAPLGGFAPEGVRSGHIEGSARYEGRAFDVFFRPINATNTRGGWQQAMWGVAHADELLLATVIFDRQVWTAARSVQGWRGYRPTGGQTDNPVLLHEDHVHLDVIEGD